MTTPGPSGRAARPELAAPLPDPSDYSATSTRLFGPDATFDPLALAADEGHLVGGRRLTIAGQGVAAVLELPHGLEDSAALRDVIAWLRTVDHAGLPSPGIVAVGAFPFDRGEPAFLVVPAISWCRGVDGSAWRVTVTGPPCDEAVPGGSLRGTGAAAAAGAAAGAGAAQPFTSAHAGAGCAPTGALRRSLSDTESMTERPPGPEYVTAVAAALREITAGRLSKVVLSRAVEVALRDVPRPSQVLGALWDGDQAFSPFSLPVRGGRLVGASPELIVSRIGSTVTSHPFAGTISLAAPGREDPAGRLFASAKDRNEHRLLVDEIARVLRPYCAELDVPTTPSVVPLRSDARLGSLIHGTLRQLDPHDAQSAAAGTAPTEATALDLLALLHPTPAVGGVPRADALEAIALLETSPRGYWAGVTGWVGSGGDGEWVLAIRSALLDRQRALVRAGAGIVEGSDPAAELSETTVKLSPVLEALWSRSPRSPRPT